MKYSIAFLFLLFTGCSASRPPDVTSDLPELLLQTPLPPLAVAIYPETMKLSVLFHVREDGTVADAKILGYSGDRQWESDARRAMKQWKFTTVRRDGIPVDAWIRCPVVILVRDHTPSMLMLGELSAASLQEADSLYALIGKGVEFDLLVRQTGVGEADQQNGVPGAVDIALYPRHIRETLQHLRSNEITRPLRIGDRFVIYKRYADATSGILP